MTFILQDIQKLPLSVAFVTAAGNPAQVDGAPVWATSAPNIVEVLPSEDGLSAYAVAVGPLGTAQLSVRADALIGEGTEEILGTLDIEVVASKAASIVLTPGVPEPK